MVIDMNEKKLVTLDQLREFLAGTTEVEFQPCGQDEERYRHIAGILSRFGYARLRRPDKGVILRYLERTTGYSRQQLTRLIKPPRCQRLPDIVTVDEARRIFSATRVVSYRVFFFTLYSMGLRLGEGLRLQLGDIDAARARVHIRDAKGNKDRFVPLPHATLTLLRRFWQTHRNSALLFPNRQSGRQGAATAKTPLDRGGVQTALHKVTCACGLKKRSRPTAFATAMRPT